MEILIFIAYALILFAIGIYSVKNSSKSDTNYFIGGWNLKFLQVGLSAGATGNSGFIMTGAVGLGYLFGIEWIFLPIAWFFGDLVYWKYFPVRLNSLSHKEKIISPTKIAFKGQLFVSIITIIIIVSLGAYASSQFVASAKSLEGYFGIQNYLGILITSAIILVYLIFGGFDASVRSDMLQAFMMVFTTIFILLDVTFRFDLFSNFKNLISAQTTAFYIPFKESSIVTIISFFLGWSTASIGFGLGQPQIIQRYFAAESEKEIKKAKWVYLGFLQFTWIGMTLFGFLVRLSGIEVSDPEATLAIYCSKYLHPILSGLIIAGVFSAIASTIDSMLLSISTSIKIDILKDSKVKLKNYLITLISLVTLTIISISINPENKDSLVFILSKLSISLLASSLGVAIFLSMVIKEVSQKNIIIGVIFSFGTCIVWFFTNLSSYVVESFPAMLVGIGISILLHKYKK